MNKEVHLVIDCRDYYARPVLKAFSDFDKACKWGEEHFKNDGPEWDVQSFALDEDDDAPTTP